ncbi:MAG: T9SS type A sorting domain-containing protein [Candidatus Cloacimonetes bacterium]|nr:T9SS type A sorting domain-containing protein [Candidatus Cloacimonadota bacterium]
MLKKQLIVATFLLCIIGLFAQGIQPAGTGTQNDPYQIANLDNLEWVSGDTLSWASYFIQTADIDATPTINWNGVEGWSPIGLYLGTSPSEQFPFTGIYDGQYFTIDGLYINQILNHASGLFGLIDSASIENVAVTNIDITGLDRTSGFVGESWFSTITNCYSTGRIIGEDCTGGLVGRNYESTILNSYSTVIVCGEDYVGGLVGRNYECVVENSYSLGNVIGVDKVGGLMGTSQNYSYVTNCFSAGTVTGNSNFGGLMGQGGYSIQDSYWNTETSGQDYSGGGEGKTTSQLQVQNTFINWDFTTDWDIDGIYNFGYPYLRWQYFDPNIPARASIPNPSNMALNQSENGTLSWELTGNATDEYDLWFGEAGNMVEVVTGATAGTTGSWTYSADFTINYEWQVITYNTSITPNVQTVGDVWTFSTTLENGTGSASNPYQIATLSDLNAISAYRGFWSYHFIQIADIDASDTQNWNNGKGWNSIGHFDNHFTGSYDGQGYSIDGLFIDKANRRYQGLFAYVDSVSISNLDLTSFSIASSSYSGCIAGRADNSIISNCNVSGSLIGGNRVGGLIGINVNTIISNCSSSGYIEGYTVVGGLIGRNYDNSNVSGSFSSTEVYGVLEYGRNQTDTPANDDCKNEGKLPGEECHAGGLIGHNSNSIISNCHSTGNIAGDDYSGGLIGYTSISTIENCYSTGNVTGDMEYGHSFGGLLGYSGESSIINSYSTGNITGATQIGGLVGDFITTTITNSYFNYETVIVNGENIISLGALDSAKYNTWLNAGLTLSIDDYLTSNGSSYQITSISDLKSLLAFSQFEEHSFIQTATIDISLENDFYIPYFAGNYNGNGYVIDHLNIELEHNQNLGLFGYLNEATLSNINLTNIMVRGDMYCGGLVGLMDSCVVVNCDVTGDLVGERFFGGLVGYSKGSTIENCETNIQISGGSDMGGIVGILDNYSSIQGSSSSGTMTGVYDLGGLVGMSFNYSDIINCHCMINVSGTGLSIGGLCGHNYHDCNIVDCYSTGSVLGYYYVGGLVGENYNGEISKCFSKSIVSGGKYVGGLIGANQWGGVLNCFSTGNVHGTDEYIGGLIGRNNCGSLVGVDNCYSTGFVSGSGTPAGGLIGINDDNASTTNSFWDIETSGQTSSAGGLGMLTQEMHLQSTYIDAGWDFIAESDNGDEDIWAMTAMENNGYPYLTALPWDVVCIDDENTDLPAFSTTLIGNYPNPFNPETTIKFSVKPNETAQLQIFNIKGQKVKSFNNFKAGNHEVVWNGKNNNGKSVSSGVFFYRLKSESTEQVRKLLLLK